MSSPTRPRLELGTFPVNDVSFGGSTRWQDGRLTIDRDEVIGAIRRDPRVLSAELELLRPGESVRVVNLRDLVEPRIKVSGPGVSYPGICGRPNHTVGEGRTHRLSGVAIVESADAVLYDGNDGWLDRWIDLDGPVAEAAPTGGLLNLALIVRIAQGLVAQERSEAAHRAALELSDRLGGATTPLAPPELATCELTPPTTRLPRVVYITCLRSPQHYASSLTATWVSIYGMTRLTPPWLLHPNELLDGAIGGPASSHSGTTSWVMANNPIVAQLYRGHGVDHDFAGVIAIRTRWSAQEEKDLTADQAAKVAAGQQLPYLDGITYRYIVEDTVRLLELKSRNIDFTDLIQGKDVPGLKADPNLTYVEANWCGNAYRLIFNYAGGKFANNPKLRHAALYGIDREALAKTLGQGAGQANKYHLLPGSLGYDETIPFHNYDPDRARALVRERWLKRQASPTASMSNSSQSRAKSTSSRPRC